MDNGKLARLLKDGLGSGLELMKMPVYADQVERRQRPRMPLSWSVYLRRVCWAEALLARTCNISCKGFYCRFEAERAPFVLGETVGCRLMIPAHDPRDPDRTIALECRTKVVRVELVSDGTHGIAFQIDSNYRLSVRHPD
jgi:hypothetical protein